MAGIDVLGSIRWCSPGPHDLREMVEVASEPLLEPHAEEFLLLPLGRLHDDLDPTRGRCSAHA